MSFKLNLKKFKSTADGPPTLPSIETTGRTGDTTQRTRKRPVIKFTETIDEVKKAGVKKPLKLDSIGEINYNQGLAVRR